ncbi:hypothetical protein KM043_000768 [Ampulex compressa]|nr:hypothetical protein KM043_000768 [Ampulex compressa]
MGASLLAANTVAECESIGKFRMEGEKKMALVTRQDRSPCTMRAPWYVAILPTPANFVGHVISPTKPWLIDILPTEPDCAAAPAASSLASVSSIPLYRLN